MDDKDREDAAMWGLLARDHSNPDGEYTGRRPPDDMTYQREAPSVWVDLLVGLLKGVGWVIWHVAGVMLELLIAIFSGPKRGRRR